MASLQQRGPPSELHALRECVAVLQDMPDWYAGGYKELKVRCARTAGWVRLSYQKERSASAERATFGA
jgi:hypothetical protein